jgi:hypothetical protein
MGIKNRSAKKAGEHQSALSAPPSVSIQEACQLHDRAVALREQGQQPRRPRVPGTP